MWLDLEANLAIDAADQRVQDIHGDIDDRLAVGALQMGMRSRSGMVGRFGHREVVDRGRATDVRMGDEPELAECRQGTIDRRPVDSRSRCLGPRDDLVGCEVIISAIENLDYGLASSGHALMLDAEQAQRSLDARRGWHANDSIATLSHLVLDAIASHLGRAAKLGSGGSFLPTPVTAAVRNVPSRLRGRLSRQEWHSIGGMAGFIVLLHLVGWGVLLGIVAPEHYQIASGQVLGIGLGLTAYTLGMRHAFDADHIAAIDNTTRKLMADGKRPVSVGFWFSLGHSTIVFGLVALLALGVRALADQVEDEASLLQRITGVAGTAISGAFLYAIGIINLVVLIGIVKVFRRMRRGTYDEQEFEEQLNSRGFMNKILAGATKTVTKPWQMYPIGVLFGLGFDTATEVGLLVLAGGAAAFALPWYAILTLPILFAAGMSLLDTIDGCFMNFAYGWAFSKPVRKIYYNITITGLSVAVALIIGSIELISILTDKAGIESGPLAAIANVSLDFVGYAIAALFVLTWVIAVTIWKYGRIEERWSAGLRA
jgi:high-affinity nickel-transport protein